MLLKKKQCQRLKSLLVFGFLEIRVNEKDMTSERFADVVAFSITRISRNPFDRICIRAKHAMAVHVHYTFWCIFLPCSAKQPREIQAKKVLQRTGTQR